VSLCETYSLFGWPCHLELIRFIGEKNIGQQMSVTLCAAAHLIINSEAAACQSTIYR